MLRYEGTVAWVEGLDSETQLESLMVCEPASYIGDYNIPPYQYLTAREKSGFDRKECFNIKD
jgi:hypothetical protein